MPRILVFDNYDSFTYNLVHMVQHILHQKVEVFRNDKIPLEDVKKFDKIILSPGPGIPEEAGSLLPLIEEYASSKSILGVCLGHQAIGQSFGARLVNLDSVYHGVATPIHLKNDLADIPAQHDLFKDLPREMVVGRYHSWVVDDKGFPESLEVTSTDEWGFIMSLRHRKYDVQGVQFHPESVLTPIGVKIMSNWLAE